MAHHIETSQSIHTVYRYARENESVPTGIFE